MMSKLLAAFFLLFAVNSVYADVTAPLPCPSSTQTTMDTEFGPGTSAMTECIQNRKDIRVAFALNGNALAKSGVSQQVTNVKQYTDNLENFYGIKASSGAMLVVIGYQSGARFLLSDDAYNRTLGVTTGNPSRAAVEALLARGVKFKMCQNTMRSNGYLTADLISGVTEVPSGVAALADYSMSGYTYIAP